MKRRGCLPLFFTFAMLIYTTSCQRVTPLPTATLTPTPTAIPKLEAGNYTRDMVVDNLYREYYIHIPPGLDIQQPSPVVFFFHGLYDDPQMLKNKFSIDKLSNEKGFVLVLPYGTGLSWNAGGCCGYAALRNIDDIKFIKQVISDLNTIVTIDPKRIYASGWDNGAMMTYRLACEMSDTFAAIAPFAGAMFYSPCNPKQPVSLMHVHGSDSDTWFPYAGGTAGTEGRCSLDQVSPPVEEGIATWVKINGCSDSPTEEQVASTTHVIYTNCQGNTGVEVYKIKSLAQSVSDLFDAFFFNFSIIWDFFITHPKP